MCLLWLNSMIGGHQSDEFKKEPILKKNGLFCFSMIYGHGHVS
jgi:hypothetical protein